MMRHKDSMAMDYSVVPLCNSPSTIDTIGGMVWLRFPNSVEMAGARLTENMLALRAKPAW
uniref:Uncharacterized protein n=1 Tax=Candidatus Kentrum sp. SD TaxID=2126332 RepID=A0A450Y6F8_9GAMM|nr:MAG: hypothetical protein BECKSD772F_GA0070984_101045 [Candidatus Kentron sp. SD]VFK41229.1 MAG: hypothetical protein BECKSD772E_GA0070983_101043 [Candidatus Kentron sp. SD]VFK78308.1 MAG: hypothetical protein BECKSD772D_GA0070982_101139 [Candidatus Kentron sp. SD]